MFNLKMIGRSFRFAWRGLAQVAREEQNFRVELAVAAAVVILALFFPLSAAERGILALVIIITLVLELINSIFERLADLLKPRLHGLVEEIKDIMAGAVLVSAVGSVVIGVVIIGPRLIGLLGY